MRAEIPLKHRGAEAAPGWPTSAPASFEELYRAFYPHVARWVRAMGAPAADREDLTQEVFLVARRTFARFDGANAAGWLYTIARRKVRDLRQGAWFRRLFARRDAVAFQDATDGTTPLGALEKRERQRALARVLARMTAERRTILVLFEIEGYSGEEIAALENIALNTVWTRLHRARKEFFALAAEEQLKAPPPRGKS